MELLPSGLLTIILLVAARGAPLLVALPFPGLPGLRLLLFVLFLLLLVPAHAGADRALMPALLAELSLGCALAVCAFLPFAAAQSAGLLVDAALVPAAGVRRLYTWIAWLLYLGLLGPQVLLSLLVYSYQLIPMGGAASPIAPALLLGLSASLFSAALLAAAYPLAVLLVSQGALSLLLKLLSIPRHGGAGRAPLSVAAPLMTILVGVVVMVATIALLAPLGTQAIGVPRALEQVFTPIRR